MCMFTTALLSLRMAFGLLDDRQTYKVRNLMEVGGSPSGVASKVSRIDTLECARCLSALDLSGAQLHREVHEGRGSPTTDRVSLGEEKTKRAAASWGVNASHGVTNIRSE
jgi:hypothetical protein